MTGVDLARLPQHTVALIVGAVGLFWLLGYAKKVVPAAFLKWTVVAAGSVAMLMMLPAVAAFAVDHVHVVASIWLVLAVVSVALRRWHEGADARAKAAAELRAARLKQRRRAKPPPPSPGAGATTAPASQSPTNTGRVS